MWQRSNTILCVVVASVSMALDSAHAQQEALHLIPMPDASFTGYKVADLAGDVDADGFTDVVVGHNQASIMTANGVAAVYSGKTGQLLYSHPAMSGSEAGIGAQVAGLGDLNGDGFADVGIGRGMGGIGPSFVWVWSGEWIALTSQGIATSKPQKLKTVLGTGVNGFHVGLAIDGVPDVNGDGCDELLVGSPTSNHPTLPGASYGEVRLISGKTPVNLCVVFGTAPSQFLGKSVSRGGDIDGDSVEDFVVGGGTSVSFSGASCQVIQDLMLPSDWVSGGTDLDGDGLADWFRAVSGLVSCHSGLGGSVLSAHSHAGSRIEVIGDVDADGFGDYIIGEPGYSTVTIPGAGRARTYSGSSGAVMFEFIGSSPNENVGAEVRGGGDINLDGEPDLLVGATGANPPYLGVFAAYPGSASGYGQGCPFNGVAPSLSIQGGVTAGAKITLAASGLPVSGFGLSKSLLVLGPSPASVALSGGCSLLVSPIVVDLCLIGATTLDLTLPIPVGTPEGDVYMQLFAAADTSQGYVASNGVKLSIK